jgi:predicted RNA-binding Zn ribbon-like protein
MATTLPEADQYTLNEGHLVLDFINTAYIAFDSDVPAGYRQIDEALTSLAALGAWAASIGVLPASVRDVLTGADGDDPDLVAIRTLREDLRRMFRARLAGEALPAASLTALNTVLLPELTATRLEPGADVFRPVYGGETADTVPAALARLRWAVALSTLQLLTDPDELSMVRECPADECGHLFRDTSHGRRRWCSMKSCGNRAKVQRFRSRQKQAPAPAAQAS